MADKNDKIIELAHKRFKYAAEQESKDRELRLDDLRFVRLGEQWPDTVKNDRNQVGRERPMLTINRMLTFRNQVINEIRQNSPSIKVRPVDDEADTETAEIVQGVIRHIQDASNANTAYDTAAEWAVDTGLGYIRLTTEYCDNESFDQDIRIKRIPNAFQVYVDPDFTEPDGSDMKWAFISEDISREEFDAEYGDVDVTDWDYLSRGDSAAWFSDKHVRIAEYFDIKTENAKIYMLPDGTVIKDEQLPEGVDVKGLKSRTIENRTVIWRKLAGNKILEETEMPCSYIPIIPVVGNECIIDGQKFYFGLIRYGKDPQRQYNYLQSANVENLALAPKVPYIGVEGQFEGHEAAWNMVNRVNLPYLQYKPVAYMGTLAPAPQRTDAVPTNPGFESAMARAVDDLKGVIGIYDASLGNRESTQSGRAIQSQQQQASVSQFHYSDNLARSIRHAGKIIIEMAFTHPLHVYDSRRVARILGEDGSHETATYDPNSPQAIAKIQHENGEIERVFNPTIGKYDVVVDTGPSYLTKRQEAVDAQIQLVQSFPNIMAIAGDLIVRNMDWPGADDIADRLKQALPPELKPQEDDQGESTPELQQASMQMEQMASQMEEMSGMMQQLQSEYELKERELQVKEFQAITQRMIALNTMQKGQAETHAQAISNMQQEKALQNPEESIENDDEMEYKE